MVLALLWRSRLSFGPEIPDLETGINLVNNIMTGISSPITTRLRHRRRKHPLAQCGSLLDSVDIQPRTDMPRDMAMERPHARIVGLILQDKIPRGSSAAPLHYLHVTTLSVLLIDDDSIPRSHTFGEDVEVVPVEMHGMGSSEFVLHDEADGGVVAKVVDVPLRVLGVGRVALVCEEKDRMVVISTERFAVDVKKYIAGLIGTEGDDNVLRDSWIRGRREGVIRRSFS